MHKNIPIYFRCFSILFFTQQYANNPQKTHYKNSTKQIHNVSQKQHKVVKVDTLCLTNSTKWIIMSYKQYEVDNHVSQIAQKYNLCLAGQI